MLGRKDTHEDESGQSGEDVGAQNMQPAHAETESCEWVQCCARLEGGSRRHDAGRGSCRRKSMRPWGDESAEGRGLRRAWCVVMLT
jgi:hypothetical protein